MAQPFQNGEAGPMNFQQYLTYASAAVGVLRRLEASDETMRCDPFCRAIGIIEEGKPWHRGYSTYAGHVLYSMAATQRRLREPLLPYHRIVDEKGEPLSGNWRVSRIVVGPPRLAA
jgi:hypothetical protein